MVVRFLAVVAFTLPAPLLAAEAEPSLVLQPSSDWILNYKDNSCALQRTFGPEDSRVMLDLDRYAPGLDLQVSVQSGDLGRRKGQPEITYLPRGYTQKNGNYYDATFPEGRRGVIVTSSPYSIAEEVEKTPKDVDVFHMMTEEDLDRRHAEITALRIGHVFDREVELHLGSMSAPMKVLDQCMDDLVRYLGAGAMADELSEPVKPMDQGKWQQRLVSDYPRDMVALGQNAMLQVRLIVGQDGKVSNCYVRGQDDSFSETACYNLVKYARFHPALDKDRKPVAAIWTTRITYVVK